MAISALRIQVVAFSLGLSVSLHAEPPAAAAPAPPPARKPSFLDPVERFSQDAILRPQNPFPVIPGKDPSGWSFTIEPYLWSMDMAGDIAVKGSPATHVDYSAKTILQHLDWAVMGRAEIRKGRWGILGDGLFAQLSATATPPGPLYEGTSIRFQQGMASLALAFRVIDDRRGFFDVYAGARYNYFGIEINSSTDSAGINQVATQVTERISSALGERVQSAVTAAEDRLRAETAAFREALRTAALDRVAGIQSDLLATQTERLAQLRTELGNRVDRDFEKRLRQDLFDRSLRDQNILGKEEILRVAKGATGEFRSYVNAAIEARVAAVEARVAAAEGRLDARIEEIGRAHV